MVFEQSLIFQHDPALANMNPDAPYYVECRRRYYEDEKSAYYWAVKMEDSTVNLVIFTFITVYWPFGNPTLTRLPYTIRAT